LTPVKAMGALETSNKVKSLGPVCCRPMVAPIPVRAEILSTPPMLFAETEAGAMRDSRGSRDDDKDRWVLLMERELGGNSPAAK
jgi:hypothetical protein